MILEKGVVKAIRDISSFNIRIVRQKIGAAETLIPNLYNDTWQHTLIIGAPQTGKTTILRDMARICPQEWSHSILPARKVGIVDERSEIAGCVQGVPQLEFGVRVDVLDGCPKAEGMMMMIRSMSPEILVVDEIGRLEDSIAVLEAVNAGIKLFSTTHGHTFAEVQKRPFMMDLIAQNIFERFIEIKRDAKGNRIYHILNEQGKQIKEGVTVDG